MKALQRFEKIIEAVRGRIEEEVSSLVGEQLTLTLRPGTVVGKEDFFSQPSGKLVVARMDLTGEVSGSGALIISVKDAIRLGGTLIMLPPSELEDVIADERYDGETEDSYGEIANIIAGSYTKTFEEMYPQATRFVRKEQTVVSPLKVDASSAEPIPDQQYYQVGMDMELEGRPMGTMYMLVPAEAFGLLPEPAAADAPDAPLDDSSGETGAVKDRDESAADGDDQPAVPQHGTQGQSAAAAAGPSSGADRQAALEALEKQRKKIDSLLQICRERIGEEVGALLGVSVSCGEADNKPVTKEAFFYEETSGKQVIADLDVVGDLEDRSFLFVSLKDAIRIGGTLIMLPPSELETAVAEEDFGDDSQDAYGEIANIIAGVYTSVFEEHYTKSLRFIKKDIDQVIPMKVDVEAEEPVPDLLYYLSSMSISIGTTQYGQVQMLFPARLLELELLGQPPEAQESAAGATGDELSGEASGDDRSGRHGAASAGDSVTAEILLVSDCEQDAVTIQNVLDARGLGWKRVSFKDNLKKHLPGSYKAVFLVMRRVDEQAFGMAIKISSNCSLPIIAAGPEWTRSKVLRAVKYGVTDILLTPAEDADIEEKIDNNIMSLAA
jgi:chemotaxis protein CheY-P-specific phosphatase CheC